MRDHRKTFQLYVLGQMRYGAGIDRALSMLGASREDLAEARLQMVHGGFEEIGVPMNRYEGFLGPPDDRGEREEGQAERWMTYRLPSWPSVGLVVFGSKQGLTAGLRFERSRSEPLPPMIDFDCLRPWSTVWGDLAMSGWSLTTKEEWYPELDVEVEILSTSQRALLQFDFGLLQAVHEL
jgi:hypothetical protein